MTEDSCRESGIETSPIFELIDQPQCHGDRGYRWVATTIDNFHLVDHRTPPVVRAEGSEAPTMCRCPRDTTVQWNTGV